ncbi:MAG TPA: TetR/AcrR family transcriptional regulator [Firmicutes bacterium]|jgi:TetR/AcrR family transcriptional regulator|nr:TetR/AcrR family transcriptional regulator [Bacillota bacterium]
MSEMAAADKHQIILDAAQKRFARFGLAKVTMDEIAQDIGMGKASLYYYFPTKESLFQAVIAQEQEKFISIMQISLQQDAPASDKLRMYMKNRNVYLHGLLNLSLLGSQSFYQMKPLFNQLYQQLFQDELNLMEQVLEEGKATGEFRISDPLKTAEIILHLVRGLRFYYMKVMDEQSSDEKIYEQLAKEMVLITELVLNGIKNPDYSV